ncbi:ATP-dependent RNA helicase HrpA [Colwellia sp. 1_MG-2023]|uniref:ATP-dependent RNA helicase HrpA n=1 Tax=Colwellia sp. 1_MG-2023 TaxID=3062649 RepID=UPI0026E172DA|nr:ATP-dependent RNA helicase HrpA [Colwellia sp. 1_MG-2023]MDO6447306.1 ATP-dependent RNA helicase HrpA [Colwellia sp. 1_MG-2023]
MTLDALFPLLNQTRLADKSRFKKRLHQLKKFKVSEQKQQDKKQRQINQLAEQIKKSILHKENKQQKTLHIHYPEALPVSQNVDKISQLIKDNQVVIIAGETGSGKTTQIPKICLALGRGIEGLIGHTQPRRIAARTVATRLAEELNSTVGDVVGYKVRFTDQVSDNSYIKLMTDGILLAEMQNDRLLKQYDTLIIDEAHERSLNIDFILGYLKQILPKRPDLKVIITSATIDPERFAAHFGTTDTEQAPIIEVSGRTFPVEMLYRPLNEMKDNDQDGQDDGVDVISGILQAVDELSAYGQGDILVFLNGEREIRDTAYALEKANLRHTQILPLFSRLTVQEQNRIFQPHSGRNIVLATNVAETSLTVPGIKFVIDPGTARISRYSYRTKVQRLPIEAISQASANQRAGRCGRVSEGVCIRLYSEEDYLNRPEFTDPEILRTNLATVILQMLALDLGDINNFPFVQPPDSRNINDGVRLLEELNAVDKTDQNNRLTKTGRLLAKFPVDPRLAKMVLTAIELGCIEQIFIIVAALSIQDPRERPFEKQQASDEQHNRFKDKQSDFISFLNLWGYVNDNQKALTNNQFRKLCQKEFLSYIRIREWQDIYSQLKLALKDNNIAMSSVTVDDENSQGQDIIHQAILSGLLSLIGQQDENREYKGARGTKFFVFPGSALAKKPPKWLMAAELVETSRLFGRMVAKIDPLWIEPMANHLLKRNFSEPHWEKKQGSVMGYEQVSLYGMVIVAKRKIQFNTIEPDTCRDIFIREALVNGDANIRESFYQRNLDLVKEVEKLEQKARRKDFLIDEEQLYHFYSDKLPEHIICQRSFLSWWKKTKLSQPKLLNFTREFLLNEDSKKITKAEYPDIWQQGNLNFALSYHFTPGDIDDGVSVHIPLGILNQVQEHGFDWQIPALRYELIIALIKGLPKSLRRNFVPAPNYADACIAAIVQDEQTLQQAVAKQLLRMTGVRLDEESWQDLVLPVHLQMNFKIINDKGKVIEQGRNLTQLQAKLQGKVKASIKQVADKGIERKEITRWDFSKLPSNYQKKVANLTIKAFPALVDHKQSVAIELFEHEVLAEQAMLTGVARLILINIPSPIKYLQQKLPNKAKLGLYFNPFGSINDLLHDCILASCQFLVKEQAEIPRDEESFKQCMDYVRAEIADTVLNLAIKVERVLQLSHEITKKLKGNVPLNLIQSHGDVKQHLQKLIYKGFITQAGYQRMADIERYLKAIQRRLEKLPIDPNQDRLKMIEAEKVEQQFLQVQAKVKQDLAVLAEINEVQWMIEELKVSLFAQNLKTPYPISVKRITNHLKEFS